MAAAVSEPLQPSEGDVRDRLKEVDRVVDSLVAEDNYVQALHVAMRGLEIRKDFFGLGSIDFEKARVGVAKMILTCAETHQMHKQHRDAAELLVHVDKLTSHDLPAFPALDRGRMLIRAAMFREMIVTRHRQGRHRSALTFGRHLVALAKNLHLLYVLPSVYMSIATIYSALKLHHDALAHCYLAYQYTCFIISALGRPEENGYALKALEMEAPDKVLDFEQGYGIFEQCMVLSRDAVSLDAIAEMEIELPDLNIHVSEEEENELTALQYLLWAAAGAVRNDAKYPCVNLLVRLTPQPSVSSPAATVETRSTALMQARKRWGGMLALVFRSIAVEQEHLGQIAAALLTYNVGHTTAVQCLGPEHPVAHQCKAALDDAENDAKQKEQQKSYLKRKLHSSLVASRAAARTPPLGPRSKTAGMSRHSCSAASGKHHREPRKGQRVPTAEQDDSVGAPLMKPPATASSALAVGRPVWNEWFSSKAPPPSHRQSRKCKPMTAPAAPAAVGSTHMHGTFDSTFHSLPSAIVDSEEEQHEADLLHDGVTGDGDHRANTRNSRSQSPGLQRSRDELSPSVAASVAKARTRVMQRRWRMQELRAARATRRDFSHLSIEEEEKVEGGGEMLETISPADFAYLQQTFGLRYDPSFSRSKPQQYRSRSSTPNRQSRRERDVESEILAAEKKLAQALAAEMGVDPKQS